MIKVYTQVSLGQSWLERVQGQRPLFALTLGFTATGLWPGISAAGATPRDRQYTALADAEFMAHGPTLNPTFPLPPLTAGASPALISRAVVMGQQLPQNLFNAGLPQAPQVPHFDLGGTAAQCLTTGTALPLETVWQLWQAGLNWGTVLAAKPTGYLLLAECVVGGTTTALALLTGLGIAAQGRVNSSHPTCNHDQKQRLVEQGLAQAQRLNPNCCHHPLSLVAAVGDPMQPVVAGIALAASRTKPVMLAGGTQMLAVYALMQALAQVEQYDWNPDNVVVGTTRWVAEDPTGDAAGLADLIGACLIATQLSFQDSRYAALRAYEQGFVKEGIGAGACALAATLHQGWGQDQLLTAVEDLVTTKGRLDACKGGQDGVGSSPEFS